jgi:hypothetical protein
MDTYLQKDVMRMSLFLAQAQNFVKQKVAVSLHPMNARFIANNFRRDE